MPGKKSDRTVAALFIAVSLLLGLMAALFWLGRPRDFSRNASSFDAALTGLLRGNGATDGDFLTLLREQKKAGPVAWTHYRRSVRLPGSIDRRKLLSEIQKAGAKNGVTVSLLCAGTTACVFAAEAAGRRVAELEVIVPTAEKTPGRRVALVIDDVGYTSDVSAFLELGVPVTLAILPHERHSKTVAAQLSGMQVPFILHLPLEPLRYPEADPGFAALLLRMDEAEIRRQFLSDLSSVPGVCGVSNHMGSAFSENE
ncbi:MAG: divergent polysaccharide deacetylase family protein, partial [Endomicrobiales bacterium]